MTAAAHIPRRPPAPPTQGTLMLILGLLGCMAYVAVLMWALQRATYDVWGGVMIAPLLAIVTLPFLVRAARRRGDLFLARFLPIAFLVKMIGSAARYYVVIRVYHNVSDSTGYHNAGIKLSESFRSGVFDVEVGKVPGTGFMRVLTGLVYSVTQPTKLGGFLIFSWFAFLGLYLIYRAFVESVPDGDHRRYALLVFLLPSLVFWPSSIGKEAWVALGLGFTALGAARMLKHGRGGLVMLAIGFGITGSVRPHITLALFVGVVAAYMLRRPATRSPASPVLKAAGLIALLVVGGLIVGRVEKFLNIESLDPGTAQMVIQSTTDRTTSDGEDDSNFEPVGVASPAQLPAAAFTVLFRPLPNEATNPQALGAAAEGSILLLAFTLSLRRWWGVPRRMIRQPYVTFAVVYSLLFVYAFSNFANFGLLTRERTQVYPFVLMLLCLPRRRRVEAVGDQDATDRPGSDRLTSRSDA